MKRTVTILLTPVCLVIIAMLNDKRADHGQNFIEHLMHTKGQFFGKPFILLDWEKTIVRDVYGTLKPDGTRQYKYVYIEIPKKQGKSEIAAAAALYHTFADGEMSGEIYSCAADRSQASLVFDVALSMVEQAPTLMKRAKITESAKKIEDRKTGSIYKVESAEA